MRISDRFFDFVCFGFLYFLLIFILPLEKN